jgi:formate hydrogenlyase subunit 6/NADH:ubiquinone oxidoreductase subunit I
MNVVTMLLENLLHGTSTFRFPDCPPTCPRYRGLVEFDPLLCDGCGMCSFVCTSAAIKGKNRKEKYEWSYDPGACTFCGRCIDVCAPHNLKMQSQRPPVYTVNGELKKSYTVIRKPPAPPKPAAAAEPAIGSAAPTGEPQ